MYASVNDVRAVLTRDLGSKEGTAASLQDEVILAQIVQAQNQVDAALRSQYTVPFPDESVPGLVKDVTRDIAAYLSALVYQQNRDFRTSRDPILLRYEHAKQILKEIANGTLTLDDSTGDRGFAPVLANQYAGSMFGMDDFHLGYNGSAWRNPYGWFE